MALPSIVNRVPTSTGQICIELVCEDGTMPLRQVRGSAETLDQNGEAIRHEGWHGDLAPHLTAQHKQWLNEIMDYVRTLGDDRWT
jgi:hypothetical protein